MAEDLTSQFYDGHRREELIGAAVKVLEAEVSEKSGLSGMAIKTAFKVLKKVQPDILRKAVNALLNDFMNKLGPFYQDALAAGLEPGGQIVQRKVAVAQALLEVADKRVHRARQPAIPKAYEKLRPTAQQHVEAAAPRLAQLLNEHANKS